MADTMTTVKPKIAVFSGPTSTIQNTEPLITSNKARAKHGLPLRRTSGGNPVRYDALRLQRLAAPVTLYIEQFSAHPLEKDAAELYAPPDGYIDAAGVFHRERQRAEDVPVYEVTLQPEDGLYALPYMSRQANGEPWEGDGCFPGAPAEKSRQPFFPDASRLFEEIDRFGLADDGTAGILSAKAEFAFYRAAPSGGYQKGLPAAKRTDVGQGDVTPEVMGEDFFPYRPGHLRSEPPRSILARLTNVVREALGQGEYSGAIWLEGSPFVEETSYWLNLLIDTRVPIVGNASQRAHGAASNDGDRNIIDSVNYITSRIWADDEGRDDVGAVVIQDEQIFASREVQKADARPGGYVATGGHGGVIGSMGEPGPASLTFKPVKRHTYRSQVNLSHLPEAVYGAAQNARGIVEVRVQVKDGRGELQASAIPSVTIVKHARYLPVDGSGAPDTEVDILARVEQHLQRFPLAGFVAEGSAPFGAMSNPVDAALRLAVFSGMPVVRVGRGNAEGMVDPKRDPLGIGGNNLTATKARLLLMACLMKFGGLPAAADPANPTDKEVEAVKAKIAEYQEIFDTH
jgi:L-asparaginase